MPTTLIIPGLMGPTADHWQGWWLRRDPNAVLVEQVNWYRPNARDWAHRLIEAVQEHPYSWLVAHSLGASLVTMVAAERLDLCIAGALLVAPADVENAAWAREAVRGFAPISLAPLPFPSTVVASRDDPHMSFRRAKYLAAAWGAQLVDYGKAGHVNVASSFGPWPDGPRLLRETQRRHSQARLELVPTSAPHPGRAAQPQGSPA